MYLRYHAGRTFRHAGTAIAEGALVIAIGAALVFGVAVVGGGAPAGAGDAFARGGSDIWIDDSTLRSSGSLNQGDEVMFGYKTSSSRPWIRLQCFRDGGLIAEGWHAGFAGGWGYGEPFTLSGTSWQSGGADCKAALGHDNKSAKFIVEASVGFAVAP